MTDKTVKLTRDPALGTVLLTKNELNMIRSAMLELETGCVDGWKHSGHTKTEVKAFYSAREKLFLTHKERIEDVW